MANPSGGNVKGKYAELIAGLKNRSLDNDQHISALTVTPMLFEMCTTVCSLSELRSGLLAPATVEELLTRERDEELRPGLYSETGKKWLEEYKFELFKPFFPASEHRPGRSSLPELKSGLLAPAAVEELLTREYNEWPGLHSETGKKWLEEHKFELFKPLLPCF